MGTDQNVKKIHFWDGANRKILRKGPDQNVKRKDSNEHFRRNKIHNEQV